MLLRDAVMLTTGALPAAIADVLPSDADVTQAEIHLLAGYPQANYLLSRVDMTSLGERSRDLGQLLGYAALLSGPLTEHESADLVVDGMEHVALDSGFVDPTIGIAGMSLVLRNRRRQSNSDSCDVSDSGNDTSSEC